MSNDKVRLFIGTSANGEDALAEMTYEYTIRKNTDREVEIVWMRQTNDQSSFWYGFKDTMWSTPFSGFRWAIPEYCNFEGRAIYTDVDMLNFCDIGELFDIEFEGEDQLMYARNGNRFGGKEFCVIVFDCSKFKFVQSKDVWKKNPEAHHHFIHYFITKNNALGGTLIGDLDPAWNSHDGDIDNPKILHYTKMATQPWRPAWYNGPIEDHPKQDLVNLFWKLAEDAEDSGYNLKDYSIDRGVTYNCIGK